MDVLDEYYKYVHTHVYPRGLRILFELNGVYEETMLRRAFYKYASILTHTVERSK